MSNQVANLVREHRATRACTGKELTTTFLEGRGGKPLGDDKWRLPLYLMSDRNTIVGRDLHHYMLVDVEVLSRDERLETKCRFRLSVQVMLNTTRQYNGQEAPCSKDK